MRRSLPKLERTEIGRRTGETVGDIGKNHAAVNRRGTWLETEVEIGGLK